MDPLLKLSQSRTSKALIRALGLPLPLPQVLRREKQGWRTRLLDDATVVVGCVGQAQLLDTVAGSLAVSGARVAWAGPASIPESLKQAAEAWAEPLRELEGESVEPSKKGAASVHALVFDASGLTRPEDLSALYEFFSARVRDLKSGGRVILMARPATDPSPEVNAALQAVEGFMRSLAKELGRKGSTANLIRVHAGAESLAIAPLRFFLSGYSAFVTAQPVEVSCPAGSSSTKHLGNPLTGAYQALRGKVALVTGASRGIGEETATCLAREGAHVIVLDRPGEESGASRLARKLNGSMLLLDVSAPDASAELNKFLRDGENGRPAGVDIVVHNAGLTRDKTLSRMPRQSWDSVLDVNLNAIVRLTHGLLEQSLLHDDGRLVMLSSVGGIAGNVGQTNYASSKAGLIGYVRALAPTVAKRGITVNAVAPGFIETQMTARMPIGIREAARRLSALNQGGMPRDVAELVTFLSMPWANGLNANVIRVCGGALIGA